jgi:precorrin-2 dehydrogenase/sirohydrochlorin ferrochelatase
VSRAAYYPAFLDVHGKRVVVVGGGEIATGKVRGLLPCAPGPLVVIAPEASTYIREMAADGRLEWLARPYQNGDLAGATVAFAASDDRSLNATVADEARRRGVWVLSVDDVPNCDFIAPAVVKRGDLIVAISTGGRSPAFARWARERLDRAIPAWWEDLLDVAAVVRERLGPERRTIATERWQEAMDEDLASLVEAGRVDEATAVLLDRLLTKVRA